MAVFFHSEIQGFQFTKKAKLKSWLETVTTKENRVIDVVNFIAVNDAQLQKINKKYLNHNYLTDVIAFNYKKGNNINGDIYISIERIKENAGLFKVAFHVELLRVMVHGLLHLIGYNDKKEAEKKEMRIKEDQYLAGINY